MVTGARKAQAAKERFEGAISPMTPASILREHANGTGYLDKDSSFVVNCCITESTQGLANHG